MSNCQMGFPGIGIPSGTAAIIINNYTDDHILDDSELAGGIYIRMNKATANAVTVPPGLTGTEPVHITQTGVGTTSVVAGVGVTIHSADDWIKCRTRYSNLTLIPISADTYDLIGDLAE